MTFAGKILVIVIMVFSVIFLGLSLVVLTSTTNWKAAYEELQEDNRTLQQDITRVNNDLAAREADLQEEQQRLETERQKLQTANTQLESEKDELLKEISDVRTEAEVQQQTADQLAKQAQARAAEAEQLREQFQAAQKQANDYAARLAELNQNIFNLERNLEVARTNNEDLRDMLGDYQAYLESRDLPSDPAVVSLAAAGAPISPDVEGRVLRVSPKNDLVEFSLGEDDGIVAGQEYFVFRAGEYIGKLRVTLTEPDTSVGRVFERHLGRQVRENDYVASKIRPQS